MDDTTDSADASSLDPGIVLQSIIADLKTPADFPTELQRRLRRIYGAVPQQLQFSVDRDPDLSAYRITDTPRYIQQDTELERLTAAYEHALEHDTALQNTYLRGPPGSGKETLARALAYHLELPFVKVRADDMRLSTFLGTPRTAEVDALDEPIPWTDSSFVKAVYAAQSMPVILYLEHPEKMQDDLQWLFDRTLSPSPTGASMSESKFRDPVAELEAADPSNLIVIGGGTLGNGYSMVERSRYFQQLFDLDYLGVLNPEKERMLVTERTQLSDDVASALVMAANYIREDARDPDTAVSCHISPGDLVRWAQTSVAYADHGIENPVFQAGVDTIVNPLTDTEKDAEIVATVLQQETDGLSLH